MLNALSGYDARDPYSLDEDVDFLPATRPLDHGHAHRLQPRPRRLPGRSAQSRRSSRARSTRSRRPARIVEEVKLGIKRDQRELSDLWCRLIMPLNDRRASRACKAGGFDLLGDHRDDFPPEFLHWVDNGAGHDGARADAPTRRSAPRSTTRSRACSPTTTCWSRPTLTAMPVKNAHRRQHARPGGGQRRRGRPLIGWCLTYLDQLHRATRRRRSPRASRTACRSACRSSAAATPTPTCSPRAPRSSGCGRGTTPTRPAPRGRLS